MKRTTRKDRFYGWESKLAVGEKEKLGAFRGEIGNLEEEYASTKDGLVYVCLNSKLRELKSLLSSLKAKVADGILEVLLIFLLYFTYLS